MPGMMDTVLNLGLNDETVEALAEQSGDRRFAYDSYRRFIQMYSDVVLGVEHHHFEEILEDHKRAHGYTLDTELTADDWVELVGALQGARRGASRQAVPAGPARAALGRDRRGVRLVDERSAPSPIAGCTTSRRAGAPRSTCRPWCSATWATTSATGVAFTRNPSTGEKQLYGEFLINAQGEDVVAGIRTPQEITEAARKEAGSDKPSMESAMPAAFAELTRIYGALEQHYRDMQDLEFTVEQGKLWMLQTRNGKRTAKAALRIAVELANEGLITQRGGGGARSIRRRSTSCCTRPSIPKAERKVIATGLPASPGAASGEIVFSVRRGRRSARPTARRSSWCASRPRPRTSTACMPPKAS